MGLAEFLELNVVVVVNVMMSMVVVCILVVLCVLGSAHGGLSVQE